MFVVVALAAIGLGIWREYFSPKAVWRRALHAPVPGFIREGRIQIGEWSYPRSMGWPINKLRLKGLDDAENFREIERASTDPDASIRREMYRLIADEAAALAHPVAIRLLAPGLDDPEEGVRAEAVRGLGRVVEPDDAVARKFIGMVSDTSPLVREFAAYACCFRIARDTAGPGSATTTLGRDRVIAALLSRLDDPVASVRASTIDAIEYLFQHAPWLLASNRPSAGGQAILDALEKKLSDPERAIQAMAAFVLALHGRGLEAAPMLVELSNQRSLSFEGIKLRGYTSLGRWYPLEALALLADRSDEAAARLFAELHVLYMGGERKPRQVLVKVATRSPEAHARIERHALGQLDRTDPFIRQQVAILLHEIGTSHDVLPDLVEGTMNVYDFIRQDATQALKARLKSDDRVLILIREATQNSDPYKAKWAAEALEVLEPMLTPTGQGVR